MQPSNCGNLIGLDSKSCFIYYCMDTWNLPYRYIKPRSITHHHAPSPILGTDLQFSLNVNALLIYTRSTTLNRFCQPFIKLFSQQLIRFNFCHFNLMRQPAVKISASDSVISLQESFIILISSNLKLFLIPSIYIRYRKLNWLQKK